MKRIRPTTCLLILLIMFAVAAVLEISLGQLWIPPAQLLTDSFAYLTGSHSSSAVVMGAIRWPRLWVATFVGAGLASAGAALQAIFRNPMADPSIIGVSSGASLGAVLSITSGLGAVTIWLPPVCAFASGLISVYVIYRLGTTQGNTAIHTLLLSGVAISSLCGAIVTFVLSLVPLTTMQEILFWLMGGLDGSTWMHVVIVGPCVCLGILVILLSGRELDILSIGEDQAEGLGVAIQSVKKVVLCTAAIMVGACVSVSGVIAFVGLIVPHIMRGLIGPRHFWLVPASALGGAILTVLADIVARMALSPVEINIGVVTTTLGTPFFLFLLRRQYAIRERKK